MRCRTPTIVFGSAYLRLRSIGDGRDGAGDGAAAGDDEKGGGYLATSSWIWSANAAKDYKFLSMSISGLSQKFIRRRLGTEGRSVNQDGDRGGWSGMKAG